MEQPRWNAAVVVLDTVRAGTADEARERLMKALADAGFTSAFTPDERVDLGTYQATPQQEAEYAYQEAA